jgi:hypothetical protein
VNHDSCSILVRSLVKFWIFIASVIFLLEFFIAPDFPLARHAWSPGLVLAIAPSSLCFLRLVPVPCSLRAALPARVHPRQIIFSLGISDPRAGLAFCKCRADLAISPCARRLLLYGHCTPIFLFFLAHFLWRLFSRRTGVRLGFISMCLCASLPEVRISGLRFHCSP